MQASRRTETDRRLATALAGVFGAIAALCALLGVLVNPVILLFALPFAAAAYFFWYHGSGRLYRDARESARRTRAQRARDDPRTRGPFAGGGDPRGATAGRARREGTETDERRSRAAAYRTLGLEPGADEAAVRRAYRERVKAEHPDRGGDPERFRELRAAYERLRE